jgi:tetratricopeptide (TPR) repeat protein
LKFQRREVDQDIYLDLKSGREVFVGRAATDGRSHAALFTRLEKLAHRVLEIDGQSKPLKAMGDADAARPLFEELDERLLPEIRRIAEGDGQDYAFAQFSYGLVLRALARQSAAERHFRRANELQPRTLNILNELVRCLGEQGRNSEALPFAREAVAVAPNDPASWGNLAMCLIQVGNKDDAKKAIDHAILLDPSDPTNRYIRDNFPRYFI